MTFFIDPRRSRAVNLLRAVSGLLGVTLLVIGLAAAEPAFAASKKKKSSSRRNYIPSEATGRKLLKFQEYAEKENYQAALDVLEPLTKKKKLKPYDKAKVFELRGYMLFQLERYAEARQSLEVSIAQDYLPEVNLESIRYNLAQLYMADPTPENLKRSIALFEEWFTNAENPGYQAWFLLSAAYAQTEQWDKALMPARKAVSRAEEVGKEREQLYQLLLAMEFQNGNFPELLEVLKTLATRYPKKDYYMQLAFAYSSLGDQERSLATFQLANTLGFLDKDREFTRLAQQLLYAQLPWQAATVMMDGFDKEVVEQTAENYELLANTLLHAREYDKALQPLRKAAEMSDEGNLYIRLAQVHLEIENWKDARSALEAALEKGGVRDMGTAQILLGISNYNEKRYKSARGAFSRALDDENSSETARKWLVYVDRALAEEATDEG